MRHLYAYATGADVQVWSLVPCTNHVLCSQAVGSRQHGFTSSFPQHVQHTPAMHSTSASAPATVFAAQQCSARAAYLPSFSVRLVSTVKSDCSFDSGRLHHCARQAAQLYCTRVISSTAPAAESMSRDKTDLSAGAAAAAAAQTLQQQPSAHGLQAAPQVAKVLGFAGAALSALKCPCTPARTAASSFDLAVHHAVMQRSRAWADCQYQLCFWMRSITKVCRCYPVPGAGTPHSTEPALSAGGPCSECSTLAARVRGFHSILSGRHTLGHGNGTVWW